MTSDETSPGRDRTRAVPFRGLRFADAHRVRERTFVPPQSWSQFAGLDESNLDPHNLLWLLEPVLGTAGDLANADGVADVLDSWVGDGTLRYDGEPSMYVYRRTAGSHALVGVVAAVALHDRGSPAMLAHEEVIESLVDAHESLEKATRAQLEPIVTLSTSDPDSGIPTLSTIVQEVLATDPVYRVEDDAVHELWRVTDPAVHQAVDDLVQAGELLIADGHHRFTAWSRRSRRGSEADRREPPSYALAMIVSAADHGLRLGAVHRVVHDLSLDEAIAAAPLQARPLANLAEVEGFLAAGPDARCVFADGKRYAAITPSPSVAPPACTSPERAVCWLHDSWLPAWGGDLTVEYVHAVAPAVDRAVERGGIAVLLPSPGLGSVREAAARGVPLPRKATSFGPKPRVGLVMRRWD